MSCKYGGGLGGVQEVDIAVYVCLLLLKSAMTQYITR